MKISFCTFVLIMKHNLNLILIAIACLITVNIHAAEKEVLLPYGSMDHWTVRHVHESGVIGGKTKTLYEIGPEKTIEGNKPYVNGGGSPWGTSNVMAKVMGVVKTNNSVFRDRRGSGWCAKLATHIEKVKVLGLMNINVLAAGSLFLGDMKEPITGTKDGPKALNNGIPFTDRPTAVRFDYRMQAAAESNRIKLTGFSKRQTVSGRDYAIAVLYLQKRTEDKNGNITAKRVGTMVVKYGKSTNGWVNNATYKIMYGDIRNNPQYDPKTMGLRQTDYARNSKGNSVIIQETEWADENETPTHIMLQFSSSHGGAFIGSVGNTLWVDNVRLVY
jgi:hypothetical protein